VPLPTRNHHDHLTLVGLAVAKPPTEAVFAGVGRLDVAAELATIDIHRLAVAADAHALHLSGAGFAGNEQIGATHPSSGALTVRETHQTRITGAIISDQPIRALAIVAVAEDSRRTFLDSSRQSVRDQSQGNRTWPYRLRRNARLNGSIKIASTKSATK